MAEDETSQVYGLVNWISFQSVRVCIPYYFILTGAFKKKSFADFALPYHSKMKSSDFMNPLTPSKKKHGRIMSSKKSSWWSFSGSQRGESPGASSGPSRHSSRARRMLSPTSAGACRWNTLKKQIETGDLWLVYGSSMDNLWIIYGSSMDNLWIWLVVSTPLKNIGQLGWIFQIYGKMKNDPNH